MTEIIADFDAVNFDIPVNLELAEEQKLLSDILKSWVGEIGILEENLDWVEKPITAQDYPTITQSVFFHRLIGQTLEKGQISQSFQALSRLITQYLACPDIDPGTNHFPLVEDQEKLLIFVHGARKRIRVETAHAIWQHYGEKPNLFISGGKQANQELSEPEAVRYQRIASEELAIPVEQIIIETQSTSIAENVEQSLQIIYEMESHTIAVIVAWFSMRRTARIWGQMVDQNIEILKCPVPDTKGLASPMNEEWYKYRWTIERVFKELIKNKIAVDKQLTHETQ